LCIAAMMIYNCWQTLKKITNPKNEYDKIKK
jgi:hypothetical protein